ncbi:hypothetical protein [Marinicella sp. W31]|uniref:hypothetical protein n=1 Tax=Marinicella sp. W31 TaxID=3023713 RepID=UPI00375764C9
MKTLFMTLLLGLSITWSAQHASADSGITSDEQAFIEFMNSKPKNPSLSNNTRMGIGIGPAGCRPRTVCTSDSDCDGGKCETHSNFPPPNGPRHCVCY